MKNILLLITIVIPQIVFSLEATDIVGLWELPINSQNRTTIARIFESNGKFYAVGFAYTDLQPGTDKDINNPIAELRNRELREVIIINGIEISKDSLVNGEIYNPENGKYFYLKGQLSENKQSITWKATIDKAGVFGKTLIWKKVTNENIYKAFELSPAKLKSMIPDKMHKN